MKKLLHSDGIPLPKEKMEEMLADYAFGMLSVEERDIFDASLSSYPDIAGEVEKVRAVFGKFDKMDFLEKQTRPARNLSVHVQQRLTQAARSSRTRRLFWQAIPLAALTILFVVFVLPRQPKYQPSGLVDKKALVTVDDMQQIMKENNTDVPTLQSALAPANRTIGLAEESIGTDPALAAALLKDETLEGLAEDALYPFSDYSLGGGFYGDMKEADIQSLYEEMDNHETL